VDANYKETQLSKLRVNQPVTLYADAYDDVTYHGHVMGLNAGTGASFSLLPPQNATGNWIKIVQRLPVRIRLEPAELRKYPLLIGLSMRVTVDIHDKSGNRLAKVPTKKTIYATNVYAHQLADADSVITTILQDNAPDMFMPRTEIEATG
jgi:membrane fusion protein (multidrug efflux system)